MKNRLPLDWLNHTPQQLTELGKVQKLDWPLADEHAVNVFVKRDDLIDAYLGGNKLYKLYGHLKHYVAKYAHLKKKPPIVSFGGAYSNHLYALAEACRREGFTCVGIIRGERSDTLSETLQDVSEAGMALHFVSRREYKDKSGFAFRSAFEETHGKCFWIPEGGGGELGQQACVALGASVSDFISSLAAHSSYTCCLACGTATTMSGVLHGISLKNKSTSPRKLQLLGVSVLKSRSSLVRDVSLSLTGKESSHFDDASLMGDKIVNWRLTNRFHCGGYAKRSRELIDFVNRFESQTSMSLDWVYNAKLFFGIDQLMRQGYWKPGAAIIALNSGGLQGNRGF